jgi:hypothetical protein
MSVKPQLGRELEQVSTGDECSVETRQLAVGVEQEAGAFGRMSPSRRASETICFIDRPHLFMLDVCSPIVSRSSDGGAYEKETQCS